MFSVSRNGGDEVMQRIRLESAYAVAKPSQGVPFDKLYELNNESINTLGLGQAHPLFAVTKHTPGFVLIRA